MIMKSQLQSQQGGAGDFGGSSWGVDGEQKSRPHSALEKFVEDRHQPCLPSPRFPPVGLVKGKSMPSLRYVPYSTQWKFVNEIRWQGGDVLVNSFNIFFFLRGKHFVMKDFVLSFLLITHQLHNQCFCLNMYFCTDQTPRPPQVS